MATVLATASGVALRKQEEQLLFVDLGTGWTTTTGFVLALLAFILGVNGFVQLLLAATGDGYAALGVTLLLLAGVFAAVLNKVVRFSRAQSRRPTYELRVLVVVDLATQTLREAGGSPIAPLSKVQFRRRFQFTSSAPALAAEWPEGSRVLVRGNVFAGGVQGFEDALRGQGLSVA